MAILGTNLKQLRLSHQRSQSEVATALDVKVPTYSSWERGRTEPNIESLRGLARYYNVSVDRLLRSERALMIGSWFPQAEDAKFHPLKNDKGFYTLAYSLVFSKLFLFSEYERRFYVDLVYSWNIAPDDFSYTFYLRDGVKFHNGEPLELEDVKYSYMEFLEYNDFYKQFIDSIEIVKSENAVKFRLKRWLQLHNLPSAYIIPRAYEDDSECLLGTGPFRLSKENQDGLKVSSEQPILLESNTQYFSKVPDIHSIMLHKFNTVRELEGSLNERKVDFVIGFASSKLSEFDVKYGSSSVSFYLVLKQNNDICRDVSFRKVIDSSIDRKRIIDYMINLVWVRDSEPLPDHHLHNLLLETPHPEVPSRNLDKAKEQWDKVKDLLIEKGVDLTFIIASAYAENDPVASALVDEIIKQLEEVGIKAEREKSDDVNKAHAVVQVVNFGKPEFIHQNLNSEKSEKLWGYKSEYIGKLMDGKDDEERKLGLSMEVYENIQEFLSSEFIFLPLFRRGFAISHTKDLDMKSKSRVTSLLYGPDVAHWKFK